MHDPHPDSPSRYRRAIFEESLVPKVLNVRPSHTSSRQDPVVGRRTIVRFRSRVARYWILMATRLDRCLLLADSIAQTANSHNHRFPILALCQLITHLPIGCNGYGRDT